MHSAARKEADCPFLITGSSDWIVGETQRAVFLAVAAGTIGRDQNFARRAIRLSASTPRVATNAAQTCAFHSLLSAKDSPASSAAKLLPRLRFSLRISSCSRLRYW